MLNEEVCRTERIKLAAADLLTALDKREFLAKVRAGFAGGVFAVGSTALQRSLSTISDMMLHSNMWISSPLCRETRTRSERLCFQCSAENFCERISRDS